VSKPAILAVLSAVSNGSCTPYQRVLKGVFIQAPVGATRTGVSGDDAAAGPVAPPCKPMNTKTTLTLAIAAVLAGGFVAAGAAFASPTDDVSPANDDLTDDPLPDDYDIEVIDPDGQLTDADVDRALELAWGADDLREEFETSDAFEITVQATGGLDEVLVVIDGENGEAASADVDLESETVTSVLAGEQVHSAGAVETLTLTETDGEDLASTFTVNDSENEGTFKISTDEIGMEEIDDENVQKIEVVPADDVETTEATGVTGSEDDSTESSDDS